jgi:hypothetical protein
MSPICFSGMSAFSIDFSSSAFQVIRRFKAANKILELAGGIPGLFAAYMMTVERAVAGLQGTNGKNYTKNRSGQRKAPDGDSIYGKGWMFYGGRKRDRPA